MDDSASTIAGHGTHVMSWRSTPDTCKSFRQCNRNNPIHLLNVVIWATSHIQPESSKAIIQYHLTKFNKK